MTQRVTIGKSLRFKVFKRDSFSCQYCGATPPSVVLEVDHIHPVSKGGGNNIDNLVTACFQCNRGKAGTPLSDIPKSLADRAAEIAEREAQLKGYTKILQDKEDRIYEETWRVASALEGVDRLDEYSRNNLSSIRNFLEKLSVVEVLDAVRITRAKFRHSTKTSFRYFCGICWAWIRDQQNG